MLEGGVGLLRWQWDVQEAALWGSMMGGVV